MLRAIFTLDYEIHGNGEGDPHELMVEPTYRMLDQFDQYGAKLTIMADACEILKFKESFEQTGKDHFHYQAIANQLRDAVARGHDVQLHLHPSYLNAHVADGRWVQDWSEYNLAGLPLARLSEIVRQGKALLEDILRPTHPRYQCNAFRAANWSMMPSTNIIQALLQNGITLDSSVFKYGRRTGIVSFDYSQARSELVPWFADKHNICLGSDQGRLLEVPIYCERRWLGAFVTPQRVHRAVLTRLHRVSNSSGLPSLNPPAKPKRASKAMAFFRQHAWKADFNQCTGSQLVAALVRAERQHAHPSIALPFVLIGHSKLFSRLNQWSLRPFLQFVARNPQRFGFGTLGEVAAAHSQKPATQAVCQERE